MPLTVERFAKLSINLAISIGHWIEKIDAGRARAAKGVKIREKVKDSGI